MVDINELRKNGMKASVTINEQGVLEVVADLQGDSSRDVGYSALGHAFEACLKYFSAQDFKKMQEKKLNGVIKPTEVIN